MKHAPCRGLRCLPRDRTGTSSGGSVWYSDIATSAAPADLLSPVCAPPIPARTRPRPADAAVHRGDRPVQLSGLAPGYLPRSADATWMILIADGGGVLLSALPHSSRAAPQPHICQLPARNRLAALWPSASRSQPGLYQEFRGSLCYVHKLIPAAGIDGDRLALASGRASARGVKGISTPPPPTVPPENTALACVEARCGPLRGERDVADRCPGASCWPPVSSRSTTTERAAPRQTRNPTRTNSPGILPLAAVSAASPYDRSAPRRRAVLDVRAQGQGRPPGHGVLLLRRL
jgi:hypothetical protein